MNVLFVCTGNTCRSPMALAAARKIATENGKLNFSFDSAGIKAVEGEPASDSAVRVMREAGTDLGSHWSKRFTSRLAEWSDFIFAMERRHIEGMAEIAPEYMRKMRVLSEYARSGGGIPDPYGADIEAYRAARDSITDAVDKALNRLVAETQL